MAGHSNPLTPLRYPGGKGAFAPFVRAVMDVNNLTGGHYLEPFAGGCGVALDLLFNQYCSDIHINDLDLAIYNFWNSITNDSENFLDLLKNGKNKKLYCSIRKNILRWLMGLLLSI